MKKGIVIYKNAPSTDSTKPGKVVSLRLGKV